MQDIELARVSQEVFGQSHGEAHCGEEAEPRRSGYLLFLRLELLDERSEMRRHGTCEGVILVLEGIAQLLKEFGTAKMAPDVTSLKGRVSSRGRSCAGSGSGLCRSNTCRLI
jgi:hypothetical protein